MGNITAQVEAGSKWRVSPGGVAFAASVIVLAVLEARFWLVLRGLRRDGFAPRGVTGYWMRVVPNHSLTLVDQPGQFWIIFAAIMAGMTVATLVRPARRQAFGLKAAAVARDLPVQGGPLPKRNTRPIYVWLLIAIFCGFAVLLAGNASSLDQIVSIDLDQGDVGLGAGKAPLLLAGISSFGSYLDESGLGSIWAVGAQTSDGQIVKILDINGSPHYKSDWEANYIAKALQAFVDSKGMEVPLHD